MAIGWDNNSLVASGTEYTNLFSHSGEYTYSEDKLCGPIPDHCKQDKSYGYEIPLSGWSTDAQITKNAQVKSCNQEMLVTWFNGDDNSRYSSVLDNASIFEMKNIDECGHILSTKNTTKYPFITNLTQVFAKNEYEDSGYPEICSNPCGSGSHLCNVYQSGRIYAGHKIKYLPNSATIPANCLVNNSNFVEIYFPHNFDADNKGRTTSAITSSAFSGNTRLSAITFSEVEIIGDYAFYGCDGLKRIDWGHKCCNVSSKIRTIGDFAFYGCTNIEILCLDELREVRTIGMEAFAGCNHLETLRLPTASTYTVINGGCFRNVGESGTGISSLVIPDNITEIGYGAFEGHYIQSVTIPNTVTKLGCNAFNTTKNSATNYTLKWDANQLSSLVFDSSCKDTIFGAPGTACNRIYIPSGMKSLYTSKFGGDYYQYFEET